MLGRRRPVWDANSDNGLKRQAAERMAINMPIQGSAAEMIKLAMCSIHNEIVAQKMKSKMVLQIHDELLFEFPESEEEFEKIYSEMLMDSEELPSFNLFSDASF